MIYPQLVQPAGPAFYISTLDRSAFNDLAWQLQAQWPQAVVRTLRGHKSQTTAAFFNEISAALQFPWYFGENWDALDECLNDLSWLPGSAYILMIYAAPDLLADAPHSDFETGLKLLAEAAQQWLTPNQYIPRDLPPTPFHVVFQCPAEDYERFSRTFSELGLSSEKLN